MTVFVSTPYSTDEGDFNELPTHVWPRNAKREEDGVVTIAGVPLPEIVAEYGSPVVVVDEDDFRSRCRDMAEAFRAPENVHYASKAFLTRHIAHWVDEEGPVSYTHLTLPTKRIV